MPQSSCLVPQMLERLKLHSATGIAWLQSQQPHNDAAVGRAQANMRLVPRGVGAQRRAPSGSLYSDVTALFHPQLASLLAIRFLGQRFHLPLLQSKGKRHRMLCSRGPTRHIGNLRVLQRAELCVLRWQARVSLRQRCFPGISQLLVWAVQQAGDPHSPRTRLFPVPNSHASIGCQASRAARANCKCRESQRRVGSYLEDLHHLVAEMVDHLHRDPAGLRVCRTGARCRCSAWPRLPR